MDKSINHNQWSWTIQGQLKVDEGNETPWGKDFFLAAFDYSDRPLVDNQVFTAHDDTVYLALSRASHTNQPKSELSD